VELITRLPRNFIGSYRTCDVGNSPHRHSDEGMDFHKSHRRVSFVIFTSQLKLLDHESQKEKEDDPTFRLAQIMAFKFSQSHSLTTASFSRN